MRKIIDKIGYIGLDRILSRFLEKVENKNTRICLWEYEQMTDLGMQEIYLFLLCEKEQMYLFTFLSILDILEWMQTGRSVKEFVEACKKATGVDIKVNFLPRRPGDYAEVYSDPTKINRELNWTARYTDLQESLGIAWRWQKSHRNGYGTSRVAAWSTIWRSQY